MSFRIEVKDPEVHYILDFDAPVEINATHNVIEVFDRLVRRWFGKVDLELISFQRVVSEVGVYLLRIAHHSPDQQIRIWIDTSEEEVMVRSRSDLWPVSEFVPYAEELRAIVHRMRIEHELYRIDVERGE
jgi:hypothetical protein